MTKDFTDLQERLGVMNASADTERCPIIRMLNGLDEETARAVKAAVENPGVPYTTLTNELRNAGISTSKESIQRHRTNICPCHETVIVT